MNIVLYLQRTNSLQVYNSRNHYMFSNIILGYHPRWHWQAHAWLVTYKYILPIMIYRWIIWLHLVLLGKPYTSKVWKLEFSCTYVFIYVCICACTGPIPGMSWCTYMQRYMTFCATFLYYFSFIFIIWLIMAHCVWGQ